VWIIRLLDSNTRYEQYVRESFYDGALLYFVYEEDAVRLAVLLSKTTKPCFGVQCVAQRYVSGSRKERLKRIESSQIDRIHKHLLASLN